jgi:hypothetical protein
MRLECPRCARPILGNDIDLAARAGVCRPCGEIVSFFTPEAGLAVHASIALDGLYRPVDLNWVEKRDPDGALGAAVASSRLPAVLVLGVAAVWDAIVVFWCVLLFSGRPPPLAAVLFSLVQLSVAFIVTYLASCGIVNSTVLRLDREAFAFARSPLPQGRGLREPLTNVESFDAEPLVGQPRYVVHLLTRDRRRVPLRQLSFPHAAHAEFVAARLRAALRDLRGCGDPYRG